jgi:hypothetical protein
MWSAINAEFRSNLGSCRTHSDHAGKPLPRLYETRHSGTSCTGADLLSIPVLKARNRCILDEATVESPKSLPFAVQRDDSGIASHQLSAAVKGDPKGDHRRERQTVVYCGLHARKQDGERVMDSAGTEFMRFVRGAR